MVRFRAAKKDGIGHIGPQSGGNHVEDLAVYQRLPVSGRM
jgi:hypothetical protein